MEEQSRRFAIRLGDGTYSNGSRQEGVSLDRAKLWSRIEHVKSHIRSAVASYGPGAVVVQVEVVYVEKTVETVQAILEESRERDRVRKEENERTFALLDLKEARKRLEEAEARALRTIKEVT